jgi:DNA polymerase-4
LNACVENAAPDLFSIARGKSLAFTHGEEGGVNPPLRKADRGFVPPAFAPEAKTVVEDAAATLPEKRSWFPARWLEWDRAHAAENSPHIVHVAIDGFFASVEQLLNPRLASKPVIVGRGVVVSASHEARAMGVKTAMNICDALRVCPKAIVLPGQYLHYADFAERVRSVLQTYAPAVESAGMHDFYLDFASTQERYSSYESTLRRLQAEILELTALRVSLGAARTKAVASIASRLNPPRGFRIVTSGMEERFLQPLPVEALRGIGQTHAAALAEHGVSTIGQLRMVPKPVLIAALGAVIGEQIWKSARGLHTGELAPPTRSGSISRESTIEGGTVDADLLRSLVEYLSECIGSTLRQRGERAQTVSLRLRYVGAFSAHRRVRLMNPTNDQRELRTAAKELLAELSTRHVAIRDIYLNVTHLETKPGQDEMSAHSKGFLHSDWTARLLALTGVRVATAHYPQR